MSENTFNFAQAAQAEITLSPIMVGRSKLETKDVVGQTLTVVGFDFADKFDQEGNRVVDDDGTVEQFGVIIFEELPGKYYCVGTVFTKVCKMWAAAFNGDPSKASESLAAQGGVKVKFTETKTKKNNNLIAVEIVS